MNPFKWRKMTWVIVIFSVLMAIWIGSGLGADTACPPGTTNCDAYQAGATVGQGIAVTLLFFVWLIGFLILSIIWFMTRPRHRICPVCGNDVKKGLTVCKKCGHNFAASPINGLTSG